MRGEAGFVLVNALVLVAAMAAAAVLLLSRAEGGRARLAAAQEAQVLSSNLDAFEAWAGAVLDADLSAGGIDAPSEAWARPAADLPLERGTVSGRIVDRQGLFNLNWVAASDDAEAAAALRRLFARLGLAPQQADAVIGALSPQGPPNRAAYAGLEPPIAPLGGSLLMLDQLASVPGLGPEALARMRGAVTVLPGRSRLNVNTADPAVLAALLPGVPTARLDAAAVRRRARPYPSVEAFFADLGLSTDPEVEGSVDATRFATGSAWFGAEVEARLDGRVARRRVVLRRASPAEGTQVEWRVTRHEALP